MKWTITNASAVDCTSPRTQKLTPLGSCSRTADEEIYNDYAYELLAILTDVAMRHKGLDRLQIFMSADPDVEYLWIHEAEDAIVFHLPSEL